MRKIILAGAMLMLAANIGIWQPMEARGAETEKIDIEAEYGKFKVQCISEFGPTCYWYGCFGGHGDTPEAIAQKAHDMALPVLSGIVESNVEPWWAAWWGWTPPDNTSDYEQLVIYLRMFNACDIDGTFIVFPGIDEVTGSEELNASGRQRIETGLMNVRAYQ